MIDFFEFSNEMLCLANDQGYLTRVNGAWTRSLGWQAAELTSRPYIEFVHPDDVAATLREASLLAQGGHETVSFENRYRHADGTFRWLSWRVAVEPESRQLIGAVRDITDRKIAERELQASEERFRLFMDNSPNAWATDEEGRIVFLNRAAEDLLRLHGREQWHLKSPYDVWPAEAADRIAAQDRRVMATDSVLRDVEDYVANDGTRSCWMTIRFPFRDSAERRYIGGVAIDITDLKKAQQSLSDEQDLLRSLLDLQEREKQHLCHEFHDGLLQQAVGAMMELQGQWKADLPPAAIAKLDAVATSLRQGIADGRRAIRGIWPAVLDDASLPAAIEDLVDHRRSAGVAITFDCGPDIGVVTKTIQTTAYRIIQEAITNACKHSGGGGILIGLHKRGTELLIDVRDSGTGFDPQERRAGHGLLFMAERARLLGGTCTVTSAPGKGTCVAASLPLTESGSGPTPPP